MKFTQVRYADVVVVWLEGRADHSNAEQFRSGLAPSLAESIADGGKLLLDLSGLTYISSAGLRVLMLALRDARSHGGTLAVCALQPVVHEIFVVSRFNVVFKVFADTGSGLRELSPAAAAAHAGA